MIPASELQRLLTENLSASKVEVKDLTGTSDHFEALVVSEAFAGKTLIERHRLVYAALGDRMKADVHALTLRTLTPDEEKG